MDKDGGDYKNVEANEEGENAEQAGVDEAWQEHKQSWYTGPPENKTENWDCAKYREDEGIDNFLDAYKIEEDKGGRRILKRVRVIRMKVSAPWTYHLYLL